MYKYKYQRKKLFSQGSFVYKHYVNKIGSHPPEHSIIFTKLIHKDSFVCQYLVKIYNREYHFTYIVQNEYTLKNNFRALAFYSEYNGFSKTYEINEQKYLSEYKRNTLPISYFFNNKNMIYHSSMIKQLGKKYYNLLKNYLFE